MHDSTFIIQNPLPEQPLPMIPGYFCLCCSCVGYSSADDPVEQACNRIAAELLVPEAELREIWPKVQHDFEPVQSVARFFKVRQVVAARRGLDLSILTKAEFFKFYDRYVEDEQRIKAVRQTGYPESAYWAKVWCRCGPLFILTILACQAIKARPA